MWQIWLERFLTLVACAIGVIFLSLAIRNASAGDYGWAAFNVLCALPGFLSVLWATRRA